jgi:predicted PurR-regulated permease PerM
LSPNHKKWIGRVALVVTLIAAWYLRSVIAYFLVAALISFIASPLMGWMEKYVRWKKNPLPRWIYALCILTFLLVSLFGLLRLIIPPLLEQADRISHISADDFKRSFGPPLADLQHYLSTWGIEGQKYSPDQIKLDFMHWIQSTDIRMAVAEIFNGVSTASGWIFSVLFITFFFLKEKYLLYRLIHTLTPDNIEPRMQKVLRAIQTLLGNYFRSVLLQIMVFGGYIFIGLSIVGEPYALTIAVFCGFINLISYIGPALGLCMALLFSIGGHIGADFYTSILPHLMEVSTVFGIAILLDNLVSYPLIFSNSLKIHPLELFFVVLAGFQFAGLGGMIVAAPVYTMLRIIAKEFLQGFEVIRSITRGV